MSFAKTIYPADGVLYSVNFSYLHPSHVKVYINDEPYTNFHFVNSQVIELHSQPSPGSVVCIVRETPKDERFVDFRDASILTEQDLDLSALQQFFIMQEAFDRVEDTIKLAYDNKFDAKNKVIKNLAEPIEPTDAATKRYADGGNLEACEEQVNIATQKAEEAKESANQAANSALQAGTIIDYEGEEPPVVTKPLLKWRDTTNNIIKLRNLTDDDWIDFIDATTGEVLNATNVTTSIGGQAITDIFEPDRTTVKQATHAESAESADTATHAVSADLAEAAKGDMRFQVSGSNSAGSTTISNNVTQGFQNIRRLIPNGHALVIKRINWGKPDAYLDLDNYSLEILADGHGPETRYRTDIPDSSPNYTIYTNDSGSEQECLIQLGIYNGTGSNKTLFAGIGWWVDFAIEEI